MLRTHRRRAPGRRRHGPFDGADITGVPAHRRVALGIALVPEGRKLFPEMTVEENLLVAGRRARPGPGTSTPCSRRSRCSSRCAASGRPTCRVGEQQATSIGRALMTNPRCCSSTRYRSASPRSPSTRCTSRFALINARRDRRPGRAGSAPCACGRRPGDVHPRRPDRARGRDRAGQRVNRSPRPTSACASATAGGRRHDLGQRRRAGHVARRLLCIVRVRACRSCSASCASSTSPTATSPSLGAFLVWEVTLDLPRVAVPRLLPVLPVMVGIRLRPAAHACWPAACARPLIPLLTTFGLAIVIQNGLLQIYSPDVRSLGSKAGSISTEAAGGINSPTCRPLHRRCSSLASPSRSSADCN